RHHEIGFLHRIEDRQALDGDPVQIAFNARYLQEALQNVDQDQLALEFSGPLSPGVLRPTSADDYVHVIMPVRTPS
ncbi:MAG: DNA polymerase III subunit beta, partial [Chloroflexota bacterium]|nr:DNA polymerase III subunit beta [Chloroflexota bacterium]